MTIAHSHLSLLLQNLSLTPNCPISRNQDKSCSAPFSPTFHTTYTERFGIAAPIIRVGDIHPHEDHAYPCTTRIREEHRLYFPFPRPRKSREHERTQNSLCLQQTRAGAQARQRLPHLHPLH